MGEQQQRSEQPGTAARPGRRSRGRRLLLALGGTLALLLIGVVVVVVFFGPGIAASIAKGAIPNAAKDQIAGPVTVDNVKLTWAGPQTIRGLRLRDPGGALVAEVDVQATTNLRSLIFGSRDLGEVKVSGAANVVKQGDQTNLQQALAPSPAAQARAAQPAKPGGGPTRLSSTLAARFVVDAVKITYSDTTQGAARTATIPALRADARFAVGKPLTVKVSGDGDVDGRPTRLNADINVENLTSSDGLLTPELVRVDATVDANLPSALLAGLPAPAPAQALMEAVFLPDAGGGAQETTLAVRAKGDAKQIDATIEAKAPGASVDGALQATNLGGTGTPGGAARLKTTRPLTAQIAVSPRLAERLQNPEGKTPATAALSAPVRASVRLEFDAPLPTDGGAPDLRGAMARAAIETSEARGSVTLPGAQAPSPFTIAPLTATLEAPDLAGPVAIKAATEATLDGARAGSFTADIIAAGLLDERGTPRGGVPGELRGSISLTDFATAIAQPFVANSGLDLRRDVGPELSLVIDAASIPGAGADRAAPGAEIALRARARNLNADATLAADERGVRSVKGPASVTIVDTAPTLARFLEKSGVRVQGPTSATLTISALDAPLRAGPAGKGKSIDLAATRFEARVESGALRAAMPGDPTPLSLEGLRADLSLAKAVATLALNGRGGFGQEPFGIEGQMKASNAFTPDGRVNAAAKPEGEIRVTDAPIALAGLAGMGEMLPLLRQAVGPTINLTVNAANAEGGASDLRARVIAANLTADADARLNADSIDVRGIKAKTTLTPALLNAALDQYAPEVRDRPALLAPAVVNAEVGPMRAPLKDGRPDLPNATPIKATLSVAGEGVRIRGVPVAGQPALEALVQGLRAEATWSLSEQGPRDVRAAAKLMDMATEREFGAFDASAKMLAGGALDATVTLDRIDTAKVDSVIGRPGLLAGALGSPANVSATVRPQGGKQASSMNIDAKVQSPRFTTAASLVADEQKIALLKPVDIEWTLDPAWVAAMQGSAKQGAPALAAPATISARLERFAISREAGAPLKPGVFDIGARVKAPTIEFIAENQRASVTGFETAINSQQGGAVAFDLAIAGVRTSGASAPAGGANSARAKGVVSGFADAAGKPTPDAATLTAEVDGRLPTALLDAFSTRDGMLPDALGPTLDVQASAQQLSTRGGALSAVAKSSRAEANLKGRIEGGVFRASEPTVARVLEITPAFASRTFEAAMPLLSNLEKRPEDGPAVATITGLEAPTLPEIDTNADGKPDKVDLRKLNADVRLDLGQMRYSASNMLGQVLKATKNKTEGKLFRRFPPIQIAVRNGVASYERTKFPIGEFEVETRGKVDLVEKQMDLIVYLPIVAVADEVVGAFKLAPGLDQLTMIPFRIKGRVGEAAPVPAPDLVAKEFLDSPEKLIEGAGNIIEGLLKKKKN